MPLDDAWQPAEDVGEGYWPRNAEGAHFACAIYRGESEPQLFPKLHTYCFPRGSKQLIRLYLHAPISTPVTDYQMIIEMPATLAGQDR